MAGKARVGVDRDADIAAAVGHQDAVEVVRSVVGFRTYVIPVFRRQ
jgi:hypothetical protein